MLSLCEMNNSLIKRKKLSDSFFPAVPATALDKWVRSVCQIESMLREPWICSGNNVDNEVCARENAMRVMRDAVVDDTFDDFLASTGLASSLNNDLTVKRDDSTVSLEYMRSVQPAMLLDVLGCEKPTSVHVFLTARWPVEDISRGKFQSWLFVYQKDTLDDYFLVAKHCACDMVAPDFVKRSKVYD